MFVASGGVTDHWSDIGWTLTILMMKYSKDIALRGAGSDCVLVFLISIHIHAKSNMYINKVFENEPYYVHAYHANAISVLYSGHLWIINV